MFLSRILIFKPLNVAPVLPVANFTRSVDFDESSTAMLLTIEPIAFVDAAVLPLEDAMTLALITHELTFILLTVSPHEQTLAVHLIFVPVAHVGLTIRPYIFSVA